MELRQIRYFIAVAEEQNFSTAAKLLNISQPPITRQIRQLEDELQVTLFYRTTKGATLTRAGMEFYQEAQKILTHAQRAVDLSQAADKGEIGTLDIGFYGTSILDYLPRLLTAAQREISGVKFNLHKMDKDEQITALREGRLHIGFAGYYRYEPDIVLENLTSEPILLARASNQVSEGQEMISLKDLNYEKFVLFPRAQRPGFVEEVIKILKSAGVEPHIANIVDDFNAAIAMTRAGIGSCFISQSIAALNWPGIKTLRIADHAARTPINCIYRQDYIPSLLSSFLEVARHTSQQK